MYLCLGGSRQDLGQDPVHPRTLHHPPNPTQNLHCMLNNEQRFQRNPSWRFSGVGNFWPCHKNQLKNTYNFSSSKINYSSDYEKVVFFLQNFFLLNMCQYGAYQVRYSFLWQRLKEEIQLQEYATPPPLPDQ